MATIIIGAGIIGTSIAFYLSELGNTDPSSIHLVESSPELFASASGYAAGFLARDWFTPRLASLGALSFDLHKELAEKYNGAKHWGYSKSTGTSLEESIGQKGEDWLLDGASRSVAAKNTNGGRLGDDRPAWLKGKGNLDVISRGDSTAQVYVGSSNLASALNLEFPTETLFCYAASSSTSAYLAASSSTTPLAPSPSLAPPPALSNPSTSPPSPALVPHRTNSPCLASASSSQAAPGRHRPTARSSQTRRLSSRSRASRGIAWC